MQAAAVDIWNFQTLINIQICWFLRGQTETSSWKENYDWIVCAHKEDESRKPAACMSTSCLPAEGEISCFRVTLLLTGKPSTYTVSSQPIVRIAQEESAGRLFVPLVCSLLDKHTPEAID